MFHYLDHRKNFNQYKTISDNIILISRVENKANTLRKIRNLAL